MLTFQNKIPIHLQAKQQQQCLMKAFSKPTIQSQNLSKIFNLRKPLPPYHFPPLGLPSEVVVDYFSVPVVGCWYRYREPRENLSTGSSLYRYWFSVPNLVLGTDVVLRYRYQFQYRLVANYAFSGCLIRQSSSCILSPVSLEFCFYFLGKWKSSHSIHDKPKLP